MPSRVLHSTLLNFGLIVTKGLFDNVLNVILMTYFDVVLAFSFLVW
jgi:hypothetical protein